MNAAILILVFISPIQVHSFYATECCSDRDCAPLEINEVPVEKNGGFILNDGRFIPYKDLRPSPDEKWHLCELKMPARPTFLRRILCVYAPIGGT